ncbi:MAG: FAD-dependent oxidoreductase [Ferruginibacter sp.]
MDLTGGYPYWLIRSGLPFDYNVLQKNIEVDVAIIGGGISGALAAYFLSEAGIECAVFDRRTIGLGSTAASTSLLQYELDMGLSKLNKTIGQFKAALAYKCGVEAIAKLQAISKKIKFNEMELCKSLYFSATKKDVSFLEKEFEARKEIGLKVKLLKGREIYKYAGFHAEAAILSSTAAQTNAYKLTHQLLQYCIVKGVKVYDRTNVKNIQHGKSKVLFEAGEGFKVNAGFIVYATGYEAIDFIEKGIVKLQSTYALSSEQFIKNPLPLREPMVIWNTADPYLYMRCTKDNRILVGGRDEPYYDPKKRDALMEKKTRLLSRDFKKLFPTIEMKPEFSWCGTFNTTKYALPLIGNYKKLQNSFFALGYGGNGITFSLIAAEILKDSITGKKNKYQSLFSFDR